jgi:hypothetical protein
MNAHKDPTHTGFILQSEEGVTSFEKLRWKLENSIKAAIPKAMTLFGRARNSRSGSNDFWSDIRAIPVAAGAQFADSSLVVTHHGA